MNGWIYAELVVVICAVWWMTDKIWVDLRTFYSPMGLDIRNTWVFNMDKLHPQADGYVPGELALSTETEDLFRLKAQIEQHHAIEAVSVSIYACPYTNSEVITPATPVDGDTIVSKGKSFRTYYVSPEYFDVFRIRDSNSEHLTFNPSNVSKPITAVITADVSEMFFHTTEAAGRRLNFNGNEDLDIGAVCNPVRDNEYKKNEPALFPVIQSAEFWNMFINQVGIGGVTVCVRTKQAMSQDEMNIFLREMGDRLTVNNLYVYSVTPFSSLRADKLKKPGDDMRKQLSLTVFLLINVFFGVIGTFWIRTQYRRGEIGIRMALGANRSTLKKYLHGEGLCLLFLTLPFTLLFALNMIYMDIPDSYRLPYTVSRFAITFGGTYLLMTLMIMSGIGFPTRKISRIAPAEALQYE
jgi:hypothetical protein